ncbi:MAG: tetratricopeptide repeat protein [Bacteroidetes bacterium]|nr:tetratricopeptide repeat protein [Bacteroidota bacterium]MCL2301963.1 tetratricopeptide repeat protein [Lentimicrobiaceae bacterium]
MKHVIYFLIFLISSFTLSANSMKDSAVVYMQQANEAYQANQFADAIALYDKVVDLQYESATLYYNLGNAYFKNGDNARALLWLERARRLDPNNEDIIHNISFVQQKLIDKIEHLPELFIVKLWNKCSGLFTGNQWAVLSIVACSLFALCLLFILLIRISWVRSISIFVAILALFFTIFSVIFAKKESTRYTQHPQGIIMGYVVNVKSTPNEKGSDLFVIHSGLKVGITDQLNEWVEIRLPNGEKGWIQATQIEQI